MKELKCFDIAWLDENNEVKYYDHWITNYGFVPMSKELYEKLYEVKR